MAIFYLDTSAIVKRYRREEGTELVDELLEDPPLADRFYLSFLSILELTSAVTRLSDAKELSKSAAKEMLARFRSDVQELFRVWPVDNDIVALAASLVEEQGLRSIDAIHLATAITIFSIVPDILSLLVSSDRELLKAAQARHLAILDPIASQALQRLAEVRRKER